MVIIHVTGQPTSKCQENVDRSMDFIQTVKVKLYSSPVSCIVLTCMDLDGFDYNVLFHLIYR